MQATMAGGQSATPGDHGQPPGPLRMNASSNWNSPTECAWRNAALNLVIKHNSVAIIALIVHRLVDEALHISLSELALHGVRLPYQPGGVAEIPL